MREVKTKRYLMVLSQIRPKLWIMEPGIAKTLDQEHIEYYRGKTMPQDQELA